MSTSVVLAVLFGALLHASWNALVKSSGDKQLDIALVHFLGALVSLPLLWLVGLPPVDAWPYLAASLTIHVAYYITLNGAYQHGELGTTYPIMRGSAPMLVALGSSTVLGESLTLAAWLGVAAVTVGVLMVGLSRPAQALHHRRAIGFALANARSSPPTPSSTAAACVSPWQTGRLPPATWCCCSCWTASRTRRWCSRGAAPRADARSPPMRAGAGRWPRWAGWLRWARTGSRCGP